jgi:hypothetical protein
MCIVCANWFVRAVKCSNAQPRRSTGVVGGALKAHS